MNNQKQSPLPKEGIENNDKIITEDKNYEFDDLLRLTGKFGRYQVALYAFICLVSIPTGAQLGIPVFYGISPPFNCKTIAGNGTCSAGKCCSSCLEYGFKGSFTSAVSEVRTISLPEAYRFLDDINWLWVASFPLAHHRYLSFCMMINDLFPGMKPMIMAQSKNFNWCFVFPANVWIFVSIVTKRWPETSRIEKKL